MKKEEDRRIVKTRQVIQEALFSLMQEKPYNKITIQEIIDRANVGRSTFYSHYETKEDLLLCSIGQLLEMFSQYIVNYLEMEKESFRPLPVAALFEHIGENSKLIKGMMKSDSSEPFFNKVQANWNSSISRYLESKLPKNMEPAIPVVILTNHISSTLIHLLKWWINNKMPYTPKQMDHYFQELINPCIDLVMGKQ